jgi:hypothetical protein
MAFRTKICKNGLKLNSLTVNRYSDQFCIIRELCENQWYISFYNKTDMQNSRQIALPFKMLVLFCFSSKIKDSICVWNKTKSQKEKKVPMKSIYNNNKVRLTLSVGAFLSIKLSSLAGTECVLVVVEACDKLHVNMIDVRTV